MKKWMMAALALVSVAAYASPAQIAHADGPFAFNGEWRGSFSNSTGQTGPDSLVLSENDRGDIRGLWSGDVRVVGRQVSPDTAELRARTPTRDYRLTATIRGRRALVLSYNANRLDSGGSYQGSAEFSRTR